MDKKLEEMSVIELKAVLFDLDQEIRLRQQQAQQVGLILQEKLKETKVKEVSEVGSDKK